MLQKRWNFGFGTLFSLILVYFIYLYSKDKGWALLAFISKWYLIIIGGLILLALAFVLLIILFTLLMFLIASLKLRSINKTFKKEYKKHKKDKAYVDVEYKVRE